MKKKAFTLIEFIVALVIGVIVGLTIAVHFVAEYRFRNIIQDRIALLRETRIGMNHMIRVLRFAHSVTVEFAPLAPEESPPESESPLVTPDIKAEVEGGHIALIPNNTEVTYWVNPENNTLEYTQDANTEAIEIARNIIDLDARYSAAESILQLKLTAQKGDNRSVLKTALRNLTD